MKKLIMIMIFMLVSIGIWAQEKIQTYGIECGTWNKKTKDWDWAPRIFVKLDVVMYNDVIIINDEARSAYITKETIYDKDGETRWIAFDEQRVDCTVIMYSYDVENILLIVYKDVCYKYFY